MVRTGERGHARAPRPARRGRRARRSDAGRTPVQWRAAWRGVTRAARRREGRRRCGAGGAGSVGAMAGRRARPCLPALPRPCPSQPPRVPRHHPAGDGEGAAPRPRRGTGRRHPGAPLRSHRGAIAEAAPASGSPAGAHQRRRAPPAARRHRHHVTVELPVHARDQRRHPGAAGGQRRRPEAGRADAVLGALGGVAARRSRPAARSVAGRHGTGSRTGGAAHRCRRLPHVHRVHRDRPDRRDTGRRTAQGLHHGAGRQEPDARAARRSTGRDSPGRGARHHLGQRAALHQPRASPRARCDLRRLRPPTGRGASQPCALAPASTSSPTWAP